MPPANSPVRDPNRLSSTRPLRSSTRTPSPSSFLPVLRELGSPVPDLASTLTIQAEDDIDADNVSFLRMPPSELPHVGPAPPTQSTRSRTSTSRHTEAQDQLEHNLTQEARASDDLRNQYLRSRYNNHESWAEAMRAGAASSNASTRARQSPYGNHTPQHQSLFDWAPAQEEGRENEEELQEILDELREQQPNTHEDIIRVLGRAQLDAQNELRVNARARTQSQSESQSHHSSHPHPPPHESTSLRSAAILQSVRRNRQLSARSRDLMQRYVMDRERAGQFPEDRDASNSNMWFRMAADSNDSNRYELNRMAWQASQHRPAEQTSAPEVTTAAARSRATSGAAPSAFARMSAVDDRTTAVPEHYRRQYLPNPHRSSKFESTIGLLAHLRDPDVDAEDLEKVIRAHCSDAKIPFDMPNLAKLSTGLPPPPTCWLRPGTVFNGWQQAGPVIEQSRTTLHRQATVPHLSSTTPLVPSSTIAGMDVSPAITNIAPGSGRPVRPTAGPADKDRWAVRVALHAVDYEKMTVQGTMEAFNVPSASSPGVPVSAVRSTASNGASSLTQLQRAEAISNSTPNDTTHDSSTTANTTFPGFAPTTITPVPPSQPLKTTFSTYLEGQIIDFSNNTFLTPATISSTTATHSPRTSALSSRYDFSGHDRPTAHEALKATSTDDAKYWRRLPPFRELSDEELSRKVLDREWMEREVQRKYVLMRWKERCFVRECWAVDCWWENGWWCGVEGGSGLVNITERTWHTTAVPQLTLNPHTINTSTTSHPTIITDADTDGGNVSPGGTGYGLSISGFYYISLRRSDGNIQGLYFDPASSPYQHLELGIEGGWGVRGVELA